MKLIIIAGPPTSGKTIVLRQIIRKLIETGKKPAYLKIDVQYADEDITMAAEFSIPAKKSIFG